MAILNPHKWGQPAEVAGIAAVPPYMIKGCADRSDDLADLWKLGDSVLKYLTAHHSTQLDTLRQDLNRLKVWESGTESPNSRKRALEDDLRSNTTRLTPANSNRQDLSRKVSGKLDEKGTQWHQTGESTSMTQQLSDKIRVLTMLSNAVKIGGDIVIEVPKAQPKLTAPSGSIGEAKSKKPRKARLTQDNFDKLKDENKGLKKEKATLTARNTCLLTILEANGLRTDHLAGSANLSSSVGAQTPRQATPGSAKLSGSSTTSPGQQVELDSLRNQIKGLTNKLRIVEAEKIDLSLKSVKYKSERKLLAKLAKYDLSDSE